MDKIGISITEEDMQLFNLTKGLIIVRVDGSYKICKNRQEAIRYKKNTDTVHTWLSLFGNPTDYCLSLYNVNNNS